MPRCDPHSRSSSVPIRPAYADDVGLRFIRSQSLLPGWSIPIVFVVGAISQYVGAAIGVFLFETTEPSTVAWLRAAAAAVALVAWRRPWRRRWSRRQAGVALVFGLVTIAMNVAIYEAISRIPLGTAVAIEFLGPTAVAALGSRRRRDFAAVGLACVGVALLAGVEFDANLTGVLFALVSAAMWAGYILLGKRVADTGDGLDSLAVGMSLAAVVLAPAILIPQAHHRRVGFRRLPDVAARSLHRAAVHRHPLRAGSTRLRPDRQCEVRVAAGTPAGHGDADRHRGAATDTDDPGNPRHRARRRRATAVRPRIDGRAAGDSSLAAHGIGGGILAEWACSSCVWWSC